MGKKDNMGKRYDSVTKSLLEQGPTDWLRLAGLPGESAALVESDLPTIAPVADRVFRVEAEEPYVAHIEFQTGYEVDMDERVLVYNVIIYRREKLPVQSVVFLLRREADGPQITGRAGYNLREDGSLVFRYHVVRVWELSVEALLEGGMATLALAPIADVAPEELPDVIRRMNERVAPSERNVFWAATSMLMGLKYPTALIDDVLKGVLAMKESSVYQQAVSEGLAAGVQVGRAEEARNLLLRQGSLRFGEPGDEVRAAVEAVTSLERLEEMAMRVVQVESWAEMLA